VAIPTLNTVAPTSGPTSGGDLVRLDGLEFGVRPQILIGGRLADIVSLGHTGRLTVAELRTPAHEAGTVDVELLNLDLSGQPIPGERAVLPLAYRFERPAIVREADLTRVIRQLLRELKRQVVANVSTSVSVDYDDSADGQSVIAMAKLPSLVLTGPTLRQNRFYSANEPHFDVVGTPMGLQAVRRKPPLTVDLVFGLTVASSRTAELFNLMGSVATFLNRNRWLELPRDPSAPTRGTVRWELEADGDFRTQLASREDLRVFTCGFVVRGFDVDEGLPLDRNPFVERPELETEGL
jgi:hypothetical protein